MKLKLIVICPDDTEVVNAIIQAASKAGVGWIGHYSQCASVYSGESHWKSEEGSHPVQGRVGDVTQTKTVKIEMPVPASKAEAAAEAIRTVHPWEEVDIEFIRVKEF